MSTGVRFQRALSRVAMVTLAIAALSAGQAHAQASPHVAIVQCQDTYDWSFDDVQSSSQGLVGLAGLAGVPYETLLLEELVAEVDPPYTSVWFSFCPVLDDVSFAALEGFLIDHVAAGRHVFLDGPIGIFYPDPQGMFGVSYRGMSSLAETIKVTDGGWYPIAGYTVTAGSSEHPIATRAGMDAGAQLSQGLIDGTETVDLASLVDPDGSILLEITSPEDPLAYPMLVATSTDSGSRIVGIGAYGNYVGPASPFHNEEPKGFYDNQVLPYLLHALDWLEYGDEPVVGLQLSHAPMTAVGRLDGDWSNDVPATDGTFLYLLELAESTGLASVYGVVSEFVPDGGWELFQLGAMQLEALGGKVGSHSATHNNTMSDSLQAGDWDFEIAGSLATIRSQVSAGGFSPAVNAFINPGDTIRAEDYPRFFADIDLYMSHGYETSVPYSSGVIGFGLPAGVDPVATVNNSPAPDYQWLYLEEWVYPVAQAAEYQAQLLDYYQSTVGRGVLYNQMWHDYAIGANLAPVNFPETDSVLPLFDVNGEHFATNPVYMPSIDELIAKLHIAKLARHTTTRTGDSVTVELDYSAVPADYRQYAAGMGIRITRAGGTIAAARIDGTDHPAFTGNTIILPPPGGATQTVVADIGPAPEHPYLTFTSKPITSVSRNADAVTVNWQGTGVTRKACLTAPATEAGPTGLILLGADTQHRPEPRSVCALIPHTASTTSFTSTLIDSGASAFFVNEAERPIDSASIDGQVVTLTLPDAPKGTLTLATGGPPLRVQVNGESRNVDHEGGTFELEVDEGPATVTLELMLCADEDGDGTTNCAGDCNDLDPAIGICEVDDPGCCSASSNPTTPLILTLLVGLLIFARRRRPTVARQPR